ncbi:hypothetical protein [Nocardia sp. CC227C]|uniref:hypothetical protein n=1 Tax=Nocardia sp. CC227C TaxID=3044562 RepID=UPI00278C718B|nr:hypothetical protein [Nocardia sp. CC227C]
MLLLVLGGGGLASAADGVTATATLDGRALDGANASDPVRFDPSRPARIVVELTNGTGEPVTVRRVDLAGHVLGLNFFSYSTTVEMTVAAGATETLTYRLDPAGLDGQATGLIGTTLTVIGGDGEPVATVGTVVDVRGSLLSVYGLFGIILAVLTVLAIADAALTVARHRLSANRWQRGLRLLAPGVGIGLMIGFTASVARWWVPATPLWLALGGVTATVFFLTGYFSPTPEQPDDLDLDPADLAAARELDAYGYGTPEPIGGARASADRIPALIGWGGPGAGRGAPGRPRPGDRISDPTARPGDRVPGSVGHVHPFGPAVSGDSAVGGADLRRGTGPQPTWRDPSEEPTVSVRSPRGRSPGGTLQDLGGTIGGTLPDLPEPDRTETVVPPAESAVSRPWEPGGEVSETGGGRVFGAGVGAQVGGAPEVAGAEHVPGADRRDESSAMTETESATTVHRESEPSGDAPGCSGQGDGR